MDGNPECVLRIPCFRGGAKIRNLGPEAPGCLILRRLRSMDRSPNVNSLKGFWPVVSSNPGLMIVTGSAQTLEAKKLNAVNAREIKARLK